MQARYYDPVIGRFYSNDPMGFRAVHSFDRYPYVNNNPYSFTDLTGMTMEFVTDGLAVTGRFGSAAFVKNKVGGGIAASFSVLALAGDTCKAIENIAIDFNLNVRTIDVNIPLLQQVPDPLVRERIKTRLTEVGSRMLDGAN